MIVLELIYGAGQGNQMFMYSRAYALAKKTNQKIIILFTTCKPRVNDRPYILDKFNIDKRYIHKIIRLDKCTKIKRKILINYYRKIYRLLPKCYYFIEKEQKHREYNSYFPYNYRNYFLHGYFESYKYFQEYREEIINQFKINYELDYKTKKIINDIKKCNSVALHIRKGDFVLEGRDVGTEYYKRQMEKVRKEIENPIFYLATIDKRIIDEFKKYEDVRIINTTGINKDISDWLCLKECKHHIIANSTYSWWAAYLSNNSNKRIYIPTLEEYSEFEKRNCDGEYNDFYWRGK